MTAIIPGRRTRTPRTAPANTAVAYLRVSTDQQAESGAGLEAQREAITRYALQRGFTVTQWHTDEAISGGVAPEARPGFSAALHALQNREASFLVASKLDRVSRSVKDAATLQERAQREGWTLHTADGTAGGDASPMGRALVGMASVFSELERGLISTRTKEALAARKAAGQQLGHPTTLSDEVLTRILEELSQGISLRRIAAGLMADGIRTGSGGTRWHANAVKRAAESGRGQQLAAVMFGGDQ